MIYRRLSKTVNFYFVSGLVMGCIALTVAVLDRQEKSLAEAVNSLEQIKTNSKNMMTAIEGKDRIVREVRELIPANHGGKGNEELLFTALDRIKSEIKGAEITVANAEKRNGELSLQVRMTVLFDKYGVLADRIGYLQAMNLPRFVMTNIVIEGSDDPGGLICKIDGVLKMPAERP